MLKQTKNDYATLSDSELAGRIAQSIDDLALVSRAARSLAPGKYRAYLAPAAMQEIAELLAWGGFSARALETQHSALARMRTGAMLDPRPMVARDGLAVERWNRLHPTEPQRRSYVEECFAGRKGPAIASTDYIRTFADQIRSPDAAFVATSRPP